MLINQNYSSNTLDLVSIGTKSSTIGLVGCVGIPGKPGIKGIGGIDFYIDKIFSLYNVGITYQDLINMSSSDKEYFLSKLIRDLKIDNIMDGSIERN